MRYRPGLVWRWLLVEVSSPCFLRGHAPSPESSIFIAVPCRLEREPPLSTVGAAEVPNRDRAQEFHANTCHHDLILNHQCFIVGEYGVQLRMLKAHSLVVISLSEQARGQLVGLAIAHF